MLFQRISKIKKVIGRVFSIELFTKNTETVLSIKGPLYNTRNYSCKQFYITHANMDRLIDIAKQTMAMKQHGKYRFWSNNGKHLYEISLSHKYFRTRISSSLYRQKQVQTHKFYKKLLFETVQL